MKYNICGYTVYKYRCDIKSVLTLKKVLIWYIEFLNVMQEDELKKKGQKYDLKGKKKCKKMNKKRREIQ